MKKILIAIYFILCTTSAFSQIDTIPGNRLNWSYIRGVINDNFLHLGPHSDEMSSSVAFNVPITVYETTTISSDIEITPNTTGAIAGYGAIWRVTGDGSHIITFTGFNGNLEFDNTAGLVSLITFIYDGEEYWYQIMVKP